jgi:hypothetical protein
MFAESSAISPSTVAEVWKRARTVKCAIPDCETLHEVWQDDADMSMSILTTDEAEAARTNQKAVKEARLLKAKEAAHKDNESEGPEGELPIHIFVDNSNIFLGMKEHERAQFRARRLAKTIEQGRKVQERWVAGSGSDRQLLRSNWEAAGYKIKWDERPGPEVNVDEALQAQIWNALAHDYPTLHTILLLTGDER